MRKFGKFCLIGSCILFIVGAGLAISGLAMGAMDYREHWSIEIPFQSTYKAVNVKEELIEREETYDGVERIAFDIPYGDVTIRYGETFSIDAKNVPEEFKSYVVDGTWHVKDERQKNFWFRSSGANAYTDATVEITIPKDSVFEQFELEIGLGNGMVEDINANEVDLEVGVGSITVNQILASELAVDCGAGQVSINNATIKAADLETGVGTINFTGIIQEDSDITCGMGMVDMLLYQSGKVFDYQLECGMGSLSIDGIDYSGIGNEKTINNGADKTLDVECGMGSVTLKFDENK